MIDNKLITCFYSGLDKINSSIAKDVLPHS